MRSVGVSAIAVLCLVAGAGSAPAQTGGHQVVLSENFKGPAFPAGLKRERGANETNAQVIEYAAQAGMAGLTAGRAPEICGNAGLAVTPDAATLAPWVISDMPLNRAQLAETGIAVFQADFFLDESNDGPSQAILALAVERDAQGKQAWRFYRFGVTGGRIFYSFSKDQQRPLVYLEDERGFQALSRPGWHRFSIQFKGQEAIHLAVDGFEPPFSPVFDKSFPVVKPGLMVTYSNKARKPGIADNLMITWSADGSPPPASPWSTGVNPFAAPGAVGAVPQSSGIRWVTSPDDAWSQCVARRQPIVVFFHSDKAHSFRKLEQVLLFDPSSVRLIEKFVPLSLDVDTPKGQELVLRYSVFKVPCFLVIGPDGRERSRVVYEESIPWPQVYDVLIRSLAQ